MEEILKDIEGYENLYQISNKGRVKSLNYGRTRQEKLLKLNKTKDGYLLVSLYKDKKNKKLYVHRLVCNAFIPNSNDLQQVQHLDENKENNWLNNLCWCSAKENCNWGNRNKKIQEKLGTKIKCIDLKTNKITYYSSVTEASRQLKILRESIRDSIYKCKSPYKKRYIFTEIKEQEN